MRIGSIQKKWLASLKAHPERQGKSLLAKFNKDGSYNACCLGEYVLVYNQEKGLPIRKSNDDLLMCPFTNNYTFFGEEDIEKLGLHSKFGGALNDDGSQFFIKYGGTGHKDLASLNDCGMPWPEIAELIEKYPEKFFKKSI